MASKAGFERFVMWLWKLERRPKEKGAFSLLTALMLVALLGIIGLAIDVSQQLVISAELQNSADACALGGVLELNTASDSPLRAAQAGRYIGGNKNLQWFQSQVVSYADNDISFSTSREGPYLPASSASPSSAFIKCVARHPSLQNIFMGLLGFKYSELASVAIATMDPSQVTCMAPFMVIINRSPGVYSRGEDFVSPGTLVNYDTSTTPTYPYLNLAAYGTISTSLVSSYISSPNKCGIPTKPGTCLNQHAPSPSSIEPAWNTRFGIYKNTYSPSASPPDRTGASYTSLSQYGADAAAHKPADVSWSNQSGYTMVANNYLQYGVTNRRVVAVAVVANSSGTCANGERPVLGWACGVLTRPYNSGTGPQIAMLGSVLSKNSPCGGMGIPGTNAYGPLVPALVQ